jgi:hypothetical protein
LTGDCDNCLSKILFVAPIDDDDYDISLLFNFGFTCSYRQPVPYAQEPFK